MREIAIMGNREGIVLSLVKTMGVEWHLVRSDAFGLACGQNGFYQRATCVCVYAGCDVCVCVFVWGGFPADCSCQHCALWLH